ncbi:cell division protein MraZ [Roseivivax sp. THAF40]|uniref:division/cell wall cluster transcriptional repressor MraZ n=1 Tax=unclassified Roseivivax TaxID=2639302 RepID=UPI001268CA7B|nr:MULTISPECIES: division/cell wall cluster transcriptional repressor MraZ [unclassified Roseivivax]QFS83633.1 cell division protein MraZ [Roseivivax sp. THAF197b]QFT47441.1 cell division protein MraZ [Roseivivax sp. THAF40]
MGRRLRFRGEGRQKVDKKGRVSIPASFRRVLEAGDPGWDTGKLPEFVIVYGDHRRNFLECYTIAAIEQVEEQIEELPRGSKQRKLLERTFSGLSTDAVVDDTGRFVLTQKLREKIGVELDSEAFFIASGDTFQIWNPETYDREQLQTEALLDDLPEDVDVLELLPRKKIQGD